MYTQYTQKTHSAAQAEEPSRSEKPLTLIGEAWLGAKHMINNTSNTNTTSTDNNIIILIIITINTSNTIMIGAGPKGDPKRGIPG